MCGCGTTTRNRCRPRAFSYGRTEASRHVGRPGTHLSTALMPAFRCKRVLLYFAQNERPSDSLRPTSGYTLTHALVRARSYLQKLGHVVKTAVAIWNFSPINPTPRQEATISLARETGPKRTNRERRYCLGCSCRHMARTAPCARVYAACPCCTKTYPFSARCIVVSALPRGKHRRGSHQDGVSRRVVAEKVGSRWKN